MLSRELLEAAAALGKHSEVSAGKAMRRAGERAAVAEIDRGRDRRRHPF
jgi:hypothetical protein